jgi:hypothetical protein
VFLLAALLAACSPPWENRQGQKVSADVVDQHKGPGRCGWDKFTFVDFRGLTYVQGSIREGFSVPYLPRTQLPDNARFTGLRLGDEQLWIVPGERDVAVYVRWPDHVERWPRLLLGCA